MGTDAGGDAVLDPAPERERIRTVRKLDAARQLIDRLNCRDWEHRRDFGQQRVVRAAIQVGDCGTNTMPGQSARGVFAK